MNTQLSEHVRWVGYVDWSVRDFHGYRTERGSTYNAYLVMGARKRALIDTVKVPYVPALLEHLRACVPLEQIDYIVCNHAEPDHAGGLEQVLAACPNATVVCNKKCAEALGLHFDTSAWKMQIVADSGKLDLGGRTLQFFDTPMVHWPESMATYAIEDQILFSMDAFGQHYAGAWRFDDEVPLDVALAEAKTYYANIVMPYGRPVAGALTKLGALPLKMIAPSHGVIWRSHVDKIFAAYREWMICTAARKVVIVYVSMWNSTRVMAQAIAAGALESKVDVRLIDLDTVHDTEVATEVLDCACLAVGSPTLNQGIMPRLASALTYLRGLRPAGKLGMAFGSHGWATSGSDEIVKYLQVLQVMQVCEPVVCKFRPDAATLEKCREVGRLLAQKSMER